MDRRKLRLGALALLLVLAGCGDDGAPTTSIPAITSQETFPQAPTSTTTTTTAEADNPKPEGEPTKPAEAPPGDPRENALEREAEATVREYVGALDGRDGAAVCALFAPGALDDVELPKPGSDCGAALAASIGYRDPRGTPVWDHADLDRVKVVELDPGGDSAKVVASVVTTFADRDELSSEDDVMYLVRAGGRWLIAKPSATFYRAIGVGDIPLTAISPPSG
jgi:hypothetical protein